MNKVHIILLYTKGVTHPKNTNIYSLIKDGKLLEKGYEISCSEIENEYGRTLKEVLRAETLKYNDLDYFIGIDLDYICAPVSKIKDFVVSFIKNKIDILDVPFLQGLKKSSFYSQGRVALLEDSFDVFELLNGREVFPKNLLKIKKALYGDRLLFIDFHIQSKREPIFDELKKPFISSSCPVDYLRLGKSSNPIYSFLDFDKKKSIVEAALRLDKLHGIFYIRFLHVEFFKNIEDVITIDTENIPFSILDDRKGYFCICGGKDDIYRCFDNEILKLFLEGK